MGAITTSRPARVLCLALATILATASPLGAVAAAYAAGSGSAKNPVEESTVVRELPERRTETSRHYLLSDGRMRAEIYATPIHFRDTSGAFVPIDTTLVAEDAAGSHRTAAAGAVAHFRGPGVKGRPVRLDRGNLSIEMDMIGANEKSHLAVGNAAYYLSVAPSTTLRYESQAEALKQTLVLSGPSAPESYSFEVVLDGGRLEQMPGGGWAVVAEDSGEPVYELGQILVWDSSEPSSYCEAATLTVTPRKDGAVLTYAVPRKWLKDPARVYPVYVDPSFQVSQDTYIHSTGNTTAHGGEGTLAVGLSSTTGRNYGLVRFSLESIYGSNVTAATFSIYCYQLNSKTYARLARNTSYWSESWKWADGLPSRSWIGNKQLIEAGWVDWNVLTTVQQWVTGQGAPYWYGFQLYQNDEETTFHYKKFYSSEYGTNESYRPKLTVTYTLQPVDASPLSSKREFEWFREVDRNGDGLSDTPNDAGRAGRGAVDLKWSPVPLAQGYKIMAWDGDSYEQVGKVIGSQVTTWSSEGLGIYPYDSEIAAWTVASRNALTRAATPRAMSKVTDFAVPGESGAGVVVSDGKYLYVRAWNSSGYPGPTIWKRVGTGYGGTTAGVSYGTIGPDLSEEPAISAFFLDGILYSSWPVTPSSIRGIPTSAIAGDEQTVTMQFHDADGAPVPLLNRVTATPAGSGDINVMLASDDSGSPA
jgi:hypothetical protein